MSRARNKYGAVNEAVSVGGLSRGEFLRLAFGAGMAFSGALGVFGAREARAAGILGDGRFPIGVWWPPPPGETTVERYREIADAGFNFVIGGNGVAGDGVNLQALEAAAANGLRFILTDYVLHQRIRGISGASGRSASGGGGVMRLLVEEDERRVEGGGGARTSASADTREEIRQRIIDLVERHGDASALAGVNLYDEPNAGLFENVAFAKNVLAVRAGGLLPYVNTPPSHTHPSMLGAPNYEQYLSRYMGTVGPPMLSFDHYPLLSGRATTTDYFQNWAAIRRRSLRAGVPSWVFIQSVAFDGADVGLAPRRRPSRADLLWQTNVSLAYGAKGVQYFTYWTPQDGGAKFGPALISRSGDRTALYGYAKSVNSQLRPVGSAMLPLNSESVVHARPKLPPGTAPFRPDAFARSVSGGPVIIGWFRKPGAGSNVRYLFVVNASPFATTTSTMTMTPQVAGVFRYALAGEEFVPVPRRPGEIWPRKITLTLGPGEARLFRLGRR